MRKGQFNTGRTYAPEGQRIVWALLENTLFFNDLTRGITGAVEALSSMADCADTSIQKALMEAYDHNTYRMLNVDELMVRPLLVWL